MQRLKNSKMVKYCREMCQTAAEWVAEYGLSRACPERGVIGVGGTVRDLCQRLGISDDAFRSWMNNKSDFSEAVIHAQEIYESDYISRIRFSALTALQMNANGAEVKTITEVEDEKNGRKTTRQIVKCAPDTSAAKHLLEWTERQEKKASARLQQQKEQCHTEDYWAGLIRTAMGVAKNGVYELRISLVAHNLRQYEEIKNELDATAAVIQETSREGNSRERVNPRINILMQYHNLIAKDLTDLGLSPGSKTDSGDDRLMQFIEYINGEGDE